MTNWSPKGNDLLFVSERDSANPTQNGPQRDGEIYRMKANGQDQTRLTFTPGRGELQPVWLPEGDRIVYSACTSAIFPADCNIFGASPDGTGEVQLTISTGFLPDWQPLPTTGA